VWGDALTVLARQLGIVSAPNALFFVALAFVLFLLLHFSAAMSRLTDQSKVLAQRQAILEQRLSEVEQERALAAGQEPRQLEPLLRSDR
jgi:F0F1-type ATP synthase membrane subunit b/b'